MSPVAFLCGACKRPLWVAGEARGTLARCGACGTSCMVSADTPQLAEAPVSGPIDGAVPAELVDLAALPVIKGAWVGMLWAHAQERDRRADPTRA